MQIWLGQTNTITPNSSFFPSLYMLSIISYGRGYPYTQWGSVVLAVSFHSCLMPLSILAGGMGWGAVKALTPCEHCFTTAKPSLCYQRCFQCKSKMIAHAGPIILGKLSVPKPAQMLSCLYSGWGIGAEGQVGMWSTYCSDEMMIGLGASSGMVVTFLSSAFIHVCNQQIS